MLGLRGEAVGVAIAAAIVLGLLAPAHALALRYASPTGSTGDNCQTLGTACDLKTAIAGFGTNVPSAGEEVIVEPGAYSLTGFTIPGALNLNIHGVLGQPRPVINESSGELQISSGTLSYLHFEATTTEALNISGGVAEGLFVRGAPGSSTPVCQCYGGLLRDSVFVTTGLGAAIGVTSNGAIATMTYRNLTAYSTNVAAPAFQVEQLAPNSLIFDAYNVIARNVAGGTDVIANGSGASITFHHSNYGSSSSLSLGVVQDALGDPHQTAAPLFTNAAAADFSEAPGSPTIDAGITDPLNGPLDYAGNPRALGGSTDIGAYEFVPASSASPSPPSPAPSFRLLGKKVKIGHSGKGLLGFSCTSPASDQCAVAGELSIGGASKRSVRAAKLANVGKVSGTVGGGKSGQLMVKLTKRGRNLLGRKHKLGAMLSGSVTNKGGANTPISATLILKTKR